MERREMRMEKQKVPLTELRVRDPMTVVVEKLGDKSARVYELLMPSLTLVPKDQSSISNSFRDMLDPRETARRFRDQKRYKKKIRKSIKKRNDVTSDRDSRWDLYDEASNNEEMMREITKEVDVEEEEEETEEDEVETLPSCPSSLTEDLNLSYDGKWLRKYMKIPLRMAFKEIVAKKPYDPVGYLGFWLLNYKKSLEENKRHLELEEELYRLRCLMIQPTPEEEVEQEVLQKMTTGEEEENVEVDWNFQRYNNNNNN
ncbi:PREDICTED: uncharacterized protein LOC107064031 [Polistes dominula]|uniref:Uncharacterized protein LOC107064031 n=1 Tax=Polistes dominula TaxID=743375 RepID=A0ABM1HUY1_POLDO|nr:PREDICTED: uncharacterized protein LOC107064031 [Polistes dominula]